MNSRDRTGVLVLRVWTEGEGLDGFRARIIEKLDSGPIEHSIAVAGNPEDTCGIVQRWVDAFVNPN